jgi:hypothetical protein
MRAVFQNEAIFGPAIANKMLRYFANIRGAQLNPAFRS